MACDGLSLAPVELLLQTCCAMALARDSLAQHRRQGVARELVRHLQAQALPLHAIAARELRLHVLETNKAGLRRVMHYITSRLRACSPPARLILVKFLRRHWVRGDRAQGRLSFEGQDGGQDGQALARSESLTNNHRLR